jgi:hypothetical protein
MSVAVNEKQLYVKMIAGPDWRHMDGQQTRPHDSAEASHLEIG